MNIETVTSALAKRKGMSDENFNILVLKILSPLLIIIGVIGYTMPSILHNVVSTDSYYNLFHIDAGIIGVILLLMGNIVLARIFNITLGLLYVYQAAASFFHIFPAKIFNYTIANDIINVDLGLTLILIGILANNVMEAKDNNHSES